MKTKSEARATKERGQFDPGILADTIKRVVQAAKPEKILLFESVAPGTVGADSDLDLLVIQREKFDRHRVTTAIYRNLSGAISADTVVVIAGGNNQEESANHHGEDQECRRGRKRWGVSLSLSLKGSFRQPRAKPWVSYAATIRP